MDQTFDPFEFTERSNHVSHILYGLMSFQRSQSDKTGNQKFISTLHRLLLLSKWFANCKILSGNDWIDAQIVFSRNKFKIISKSKSNFKFGYHKEDFVAQKEDNSILFIKSSTNLGQKLNFLTPRNRDLIFEFFQIITACNIANQKLQHFDEIKFPTLLSESDFLFSMVIYQWTQKESEYPIILVENDAIFHVTIKLDQKSMQIVYTDSNKPIEFQFSFNWMLYRNVMNPRRMRIHPTNQDFCEFECTSTQTRDFLLSLVSLHCKLPNTASVLRILSHENGDMQLNLNMDLFQNVNQVQHPTREKIEQVLNSVIASRFFKTHVLIFAEHRHGALTLTDSFIKLNDGEVDLFFKYETSSMLINKQNNAYILLEVHEKTKPQRIILSPKKIEEVNLILNIFFYFKLIHKHPNFIWNHDMIQEFTYQTSEKEFLQPEKTIQISRLLSRNLTTTVTITTKQIEEMQEKQKQLIKKINLRLFSRTSPVTEIDAKALIYTDSEILSVYKSKQQILRVQITKDLKIGHEFVNQRNVLTISVPNSFVLKIFDRTSDWEVLYEAIQSQLNQ
ncbi:hypothetical protein M0811_09228 [Anaeramoeba ignava]|uniref:Uncharacterized protein n=1 Tax=Anaeramoeba ignava TaxID=1746090 RepID=A0A9Q0RAF2_ANAIG|nr:hypothetical protein M0811_09228 [Anaeramoeba ignava]|eukprot:Anaeramoba_ignava/a608478_174.p1 GENE.a608478_174~~a608478_174.p1  ORF type:complete len:562 (-),score=134.97 a608478_174:28-1713(-)